MQQGPGYVPCRRSIQSKTRGEAFTQIWEARSRRTNNTTGPEVSAHLSCSRYRKLVKSHPAVLCTWWEGQIGFKTSI